MYADVPLEELEEVYVDVSKEMTKIDRVSNPCTCLKEFCDAHKYDITFRICNNAWWCFFRLFSADDVFLTTKFPVKKGTIVHGRRMVAHDMIILLNDFGLWDGRPYQPDMFDPFLRKSHKNIAKTIAQRRPLSASVRLNALMTSHKVLSVNYIHYYNPDGGWACTCVVDLRDGDTIGCNSIILKGEKAKKEVKEMAAQMVLDELWL